MIRTLKNLRDFLTPEQLKWLPGNLAVIPCILLSQSVGGDGEPLRTIVHVFNDLGTFIGTIEQPDYIPQKR